MISFVLFHKVSEPSMNFNILKLVYWFYHFYKLNNSSVRASLRFLVYMYFLDVHCSATTRNFLLRPFLEDVNTRRRIFLSVVQLDTVLCSLSALLQISSIFGKLSFSHNVIFSILEQKPDSKLLDVQCIDKYMYTYFCNHFMQFLETKPEFFCLIYTTTTAQVKSNSST